MSNICPLERIRFRFPRWDHLICEVKDDQSVTGDTPQLPAWAPARRPRPSVFTCQKHSERRHHHRTSPPGGLTSADVRGSAWGRGAGSPPCGAEHGSEGSCAAPAWRMVPVSPSVSHSFPGWNPVEEEKAGFFFFQSGGPRTGAGTRPHVCLRASVSLRRYPRPFGAMATAECQVADYLKRAAETLQSSPTTRVYVFRNVPIKHTRVYVHLEYVNI